MHNLDERNKWLLAEQADLLRICTVEACRGTGNGGQKRNKTSSAIRVVHTSTNLFASSDETRSQHQNKHLAVRALKIEIALNCRLPFDDTTKILWAPSLTNDEYYALWLAIVWDCLAENDWQPSAVAKIFNKSTSSLLKSIFRDKKAWQILNKNRQALGLFILRSP